ncbi:amidinotransferase [Chitinophaga silvatica]|uniref:Amidinotransferase n=1 Tax=Chitinophaga silvatica TaxID=2282649 RepID=A0A3E1Y475_9BACT|nr:arginine deiminase family protein [Chitinophaga silvatica]RFS19485.1 amidinotransferase [Chitinophaga silvatica]
MIYVQNEFATLKRVVLAESEFGFPLEPRLEDLRFLKESAIQETLEHKGQDYKDAFPASQKQWEQEKIALIKVLMKYGVEVLRPRKLTLAEKQAAGNFGYSNFFARDPFFTIGNCVIEGSMRFLHRRNEIFPIREIINTIVYPEDCIYVSAPRAEITAVNDPTLGVGPFIEGGDVLVLNKQVFVGNSGLASNKLGIEWLSKFLRSYGYKVEMARLHPDILHLDCALGMIRDGLMIVCEDAFLDGIPDSLQSWKRINVSLEEATILATNGLPVSAEVYITDPAFSRIGEQIAAYGIHVEYVDYSVSRNFGGSFRCTTQPLLRMD